MGYPIPGVTFTHLCVYKYPGEYRGATPRRAGVQMRAPARAYLIIVRAVIISGTGMCILFERHCAGPRARARALRRIVFPGYFLHPYDKINITSASQAGIYRCDTPAIHGYIVSKSRNRHRITNVRGIITRARVKFARISDGRWIFRDSRCSPRAIGRLLSEDRAITISDDTYTR